MGQHYATFLCSTSVIQCNATIDLEQSAIWHYLASRCHPDLVCHEIDLAQAWTAEGDLGVCYAVYYPCCSFCSIPTVHAPCPPCVNVSSPSLNPDQRCPPGDMCAWFLDWLSRRDLSFAGLFSIARRRNTGFLSLFCPLASSFLLLGCNLVNCRLCLAYVGCAD